MQIPSELSGLLRSSTAFFSALLLGIGVLALVIGGLSLANTMAAAVFERIRDFGVKRALGASDLQLGREVLGEALAVTLSGGALGRGRWPCSWAARSTGGSRAPDSSSSCSRAALLGGALVFSVLLGVGGGELRDAPSRAAVAGRGDPARCLRRAGS